MIDSTLAGGAQAWYNNQKLNANISIDAGDGNDTIRTPGAGDVVIDAGAGNDVVYTDNTGTLATANATGTAGTAAVAYSSAAAAELAAGQAAAVTSNTTGFVYTALGTATGAAVTTAAVAAALDTLNLVTPVAIVPGTTTNASIVTGIANAVTAGSLTLTQAIALNLAYGSILTGTVVAPTTVAGAASITYGATVAGDVSAAGFIAGNALLDTYITAAKAAEAAATANDLLVAGGSAYNDTLTAPAAGELLNATQQAVVFRTQAVNGVFDPVVPVAAGTQTTVTNLTALNAALVLGATDVQVVAALQTAIANGSVSVADAGTLFARAVNTAGTVDATELLNTQAFLVPLQTAAINANTTAQAALTAAIAADVTVVNAAAAAAAASATAGDGNTVVLGVVQPQLDNIGSLEAAAGVVAASAALTAANAVAITGLTAATAAQANLAALKAAITAGSTDLAVVTATTNAVANGSIAAGDKTNIDNAATAVTGTVGAPVTATEKIAIDVLITALQVTNDATVATATVNAANLASIVTATTTASTIAAAAAASGPQSLTIVSPRAVFVFDTTNQTAAYNRVQADDRNLADLKSDVNNVNNFFNSTVKVSYKGIDASVIVAGTGYKTSDLEINQALKLLINGDAVLKTLLVATDGPANTLVVTSLIDGAQATTALAVSVTLPAVGVLTAGDIAGAAAAYSLPVGTTEATLLASLTAAKTAFDTKGDYTTQFAESGAAGGNVVLTGANSTSSSDNTITGGAGNDVIVLVTTVGTDAMTSSNERVVSSGVFGADTIVNFSANGLGIDTLDFTALNGRGNVALNSLALDKSIVIAAPTAVGATVLTAVQIAALFTDSATAIAHVYVAVDSTNIGSIWQVADAAGTAAGNVVATLVGSIDLADTSWSTLTAANFS